MNIRDAILKAADHIERNPDLLDMALMSSPNGPEDSACLVGRVAQFAGEPRGQSCGFRAGPASLSDKLLGVRWGEFIDRIAALAGFDDEFSIMQFCGNPAMASALRAYADKYHPAPSYDWNGLADRLARETEKPRELESIP